MAGKILNDGTNMIKQFFKGLLFLVIPPVLFVIVSLVLSSIPVDRSDIDDKHSNLSIYLHTNGVHLDIAVPVKQLDDAVLADLKYNHRDAYLSFGWGDENFYLNTQTWGDLTLSNAIRAMFLKSPTLMHITRYQNPRKGWIKIALSKGELEKINAYLLQSFTINEAGAKTILADKGYGTNDDFYRANGSYSCFNTCNSWVNTAFKTSGLKACYWTPFDFSLMNLYKRE